MINPPITNTAVSGMPAAQAGVAAAVASTSRQVGQTLGIAVLGAVAGAGAGQSFGPGFAAATHPAWWIISALGVVILLVGQLTTTSWAQETASATAAGSPRAAFTRAETPPCADPSGPRTKKSRPRPEGLRDGSS